MFSAGSFSQRPTFFTRKVREVENAHSSVDIAFAFSGLQELSSIVVPLLRMSPHDCTSGLTMAFIDMLLELVTEQALAQWNAPAELWGAVSDFSSAWQQVPRDKRSVVEAAETVSVVAQAWKIPQGQPQSNLVRSTIGARIFFACELIVVCGTLIILYSSFFNKLGVMTGLFLGFLLSIANKVSLVKNIKQESRNIERADSLTFRIGSILAEKDLYLVSLNPLNGQSAGAAQLDRSGLADEFEEYNETAHTHRGRTTAKGFLMSSEDADKHKADIEALIAEADDDDGWMILRLAGHPNVKVQMPALNRHLMIVVTDRSGKVLFWNDGARFVCGFSSLDVTGKPATTFLYGSKTVETYERMVEAAARGVELSAKTLSLASSVYGYVPVRASVVPALSDDRHVGYVMIASQVEGGSVKSQALLHQFVVHELKEELQCAIESLSHPGVQRCYSMLQKLKWGTLQDVAVAAREWRPIQVHAMIGEALRMRLRDRTVALQFKTDVPEAAVLDRVQFADAVRDVVDMVDGKAHVELSCRPFTEVLRVLVISVSPFTGTSDALVPFNARLAEICADVSAHADSLHLAVPFLVDGSSGLSSTQHAENPVGQTSKSAYPMTVILLESNQIFRHNISSVIWACGHSMRIMDSVAQAVQNVRDPSQHIDCAIVDSDARDIDPLLRALDNQHIPYVLTTENTANLGARRLFKPIDAKLLSVNLEDVAKGVHEKKRHEEEVLRQREVFGKVRNSPWERGRKLGRGAFADVYEATSTLTGGKMAVKCIRPASGVDQEQWIKTLLNEIEILCSLSHPNIIHYFYCESGGGTINLFMELAQEGSLQELLLQEEGHVMSEAKTAQVMKELLQAINYLHTNKIIHRDVKPGNILLSDGKVKLSDFGTATNQVAMDTQGTVFYMAPEVVDGRQYGMACDIWSVGCVACECVGIQREPCEHDMLGFQAPSTFPTSTSVSLKDFIMQCMHSNPDDRPTAGSLLLHDFILNSTAPTVEMKQGKGDLGNATAGPAKITAGAAAGSVQQWSADSDAGKEEDGDASDQSSVASW